MHCLWFVCVWEALNKRNLIPVPVLCVRIKQLKYVVYSDKVTYNYIGDYREMLFGGRPKQLLNIVQYFVKYVRPETLTVDVSRFLYLLQ